MRPARGVRTLKRRGKAWNKKDVDALRAFAATLDFKVRDFEWGFPTDPTKWDVSDLDTMTKAIEAMSVVDSVDREQNDDLDRLRKKLFSFACKMGRTEVSCWSKMIAMGLLDDKVANRIRVSFHSRKCYVDTTTDFTSVIPRWAHLSNTTEKMISSIKFASETGVW